MGSSSGGGEGQSATGLRFTRQRNGYDAADAVSEVSRDAGAAPGAGELPLPVRRALMVCYIRVKCSRAILMEIYYLLNIYIQIYIYI